MHTTFNWILSSKVPTGLNPIKRNNSADDNSARVNHTFGSPRAPLQQRVSRATTIYDRGRAEARNQVDSAAGRSFTNDMGDGTTTPAAIAKDAACAPQSFSGSCTADTPDDKPIETLILHSPIEQDSASLRADHDIVQGKNADILGGDSDDTIMDGQADTLLTDEKDGPLILRNCVAPGATATFNGEKGAQTLYDTLQLTADIRRDDITFANADNAAEELSGSFTVNGKLVTFAEIENIICFTPGARILTPRGERAVESLRPGDMVITRDHGAQPLRWVGRRSVPGVGRFAPVKVAAHVVEGARVPLLLSPQHQLLITGYEAQLLFGCDEVLVAAKHLVDGRAVTQTPQSTVTYIHLMFDRHEVIYAEGFATESFFADDAALSAVDDCAREELFKAFPQLRSGATQHHETARPCLHASEARLLRERLECCAA